MEQEFRHSTDASAADAGSQPDQEFDIGEIDALEDLARFEAEHRRILAMQALYYKRRKAGGVA